MIQPGSLTRRGVKICGLTEEAGFDACVEHQADWVGFVFFDRSPRNVAPQWAQTLSLRHAGGPERVGLFVHPENDDIARVLDYVSLDVLQVYASPARVSEIQQCFGLPVWLSYAVTRRSDLPEAEMLSADRLLIEPKPPAQSDRPGGNAVTLDWSVLTGWTPDFEWMLAGGLTPHNVAQAIGQTGAPAVDVSSGVEVSPGQKSPEAIKAFIRNARYDAFSV